MNQTGKDLSCPRHVPYTQAHSFFAEITDPFNFLFSFMNSPHFYEAWKIKQAAYNSGLNYGPPTPSVQGFCIIAPNRLLPSKTGMLPFEAVNIPCKQPLMVQWAHFFVLEARLPNEQALDSQVFATTVILARKNKSKRSANGEKLWRTSSSYAKLRIA